MIMMENKTKLLKSVEYDNDPDEPHFDIYAIIDEILEHQNE